MQISTKGILPLLSLCAWLCMGLLVVPGCGDNGNGDGDGGDNNGQMCQGNINVDAQSAQPLAAGASTTGYICPIRNEHWYSLTVPSGQPLVTINLSNNTTLSPVLLTYTLHQSTGSMAPVAQPPAPMSSSNAVQSLHFTHCVPQTGTTYLLQVQSYGDSAQDLRNPFTLSYTTAANPDPNYPADNSAAGAITATGAAQTGYIACSGSQVYYQATVPASTLIQISLTTAAATPNLNLQYTLRDQNMNFLSSGQVQNGRTATDLATVLATPAAGTYYVIIADQMNTGSDSKTPYMITMRPFQEPDANDRPVRNDAPATATQLGSWACGAAATFGKTAYLASAGDIDWYAVTLTGVSAACPANIDVEANWAGAGTTLSPQIELLYPDAKTPCTVDTDCRYQQSQAGTGILTKGCGSDNDCQYLGNQCDTLQSHQCTGSGQCLPSKFCGAIQFTKQQNNTTGAGAYVRTAQPLTAAGTYFIGVRDYGGTGYDFNDAYALTVRLNPDINEPDNFYTPYQEQDALGLETSVARPLTLGTTYTSKIGYEGDRDYYVFPHPCPGAYCTLSVTYSTSGASPVYFTYQVEANDGTLVAGFPAAPSPRLSVGPQVPSTVFGGVGSNQCFYADKRFAGPFYLWVSDLLAGGPLWDPNTTYSFTVNKVMDGCSVACMTAPFTCGQ